MNRAKAVFSPRLLFLVGMLVGLCLLWMLKTSWHPRPALQAESTDLALYPWIYQRAPLPGNGDETYAVVLVGDVLPGRIQPDNALPTRVGPGWTLPAAIQTADLLVGNLEGVIASLPVTPDPTRAPYLLAGAPEMAQALASAGFDLFGLANNHSLDLGAAGLQATAEALTQAGIGYFGAGPDGNLAAQPLLRQVGPLQVSFLAVTAVQNPPPGAESPGAGSSWAPAEWGPEFLAQVQRARQQADLVIVMIHWGYEYQRRADPAQRRIAEMLLQAGADLVVGCHPHVLQEIEIFHQETSARPQIVAYSLGNFLFDSAEPGATQGLALRLLLDQQGLLGIQALPIAASLQPSLLSPEAADLLLQSLLQPASEAVFACDSQTCSVLEQPDLDARQQTSGLFWSGSIDLTGDLAPELVRRQGGQIIVYEQGLETWRTPPEWRILDAALGDPDWDGRADIVLAMLKPDAGGVLRSHPFIMGYRGGIYRNLWGGSAVSDPILELELGNIDESPQQELVVLEERASGLQAVTVWNWHGWGFSLRWRSPEAAYENLRLALDEAGGPAWIMVDYR